MVKLVRVACVTSGEFCWVDMTFVVGDLPHLLTCMHWEPSLAPEALIPSSVRLHAGASVPRLIPVISPAGASRGL